MNLFNTLTSILNAKFSGNIYRKTAFTGSHSVRGTLNDQYLTKYHAADARYYIALYGYYISQVKAVLIQYNKIWLDQTSTGAATDLRSIVVHTRLTRTLH